MYVLAIMATVAFVSCNKGDNKAEGENQDSTKVENAEKKCCDKDAADKQCCQAKEEVDPIEAMIREFEAACEVGDQEALWAVMEKLDAAGIEYDNLTEEQQKRIDRAGEAMEEAHARRQMEMMMEEDEEE